MKTGDNANQLIVEAVNDANKIAQWLCDTYDLKLEHPRILRRPHFAIKSDISNDVFDAVGEITTPNAKLDRSEGDKGEIDVF
ncbi:MAG: hypothetical protein Q6373_013040, partial [Candidatus Sigynarchaeota archaeon]